jgi:hypothetical protein
MVRNAKDVPGLKILNTDNSVQNSTTSVFSGSAEKSTSKKGNLTSSSSSSDSSR